MSDRDFLGELEQMVLLAVLRLQGKGYAVSIRQEIETRTGRDVSRGSIYITLDRLESKGYLRSWLADPTPMRGGKAKRYYEVEQPAVPVLKESRRALLQLWRGLESVLA
jgi:PadR family transcriptional regulator, regulatory protein PadR